jgi:lipopolysaccharide biosynthesis protein
MPHSVDHARAWHDAGFKVVIVVIVDSLTSPIDTAQLDFANAVLLRVNSGYDFGAWSATIRLLGRSVRRYALLVTANDSVLGPSNRFAAMLERVDRMDADVVGLVESVEVARHFQSFVLFFKPLALRSRVFRQFWGSIRTGNRDYVIDNYELKLRDRFIQAGLRVEAVHPVGSGPANNPTLHAWRELLSDGFPYIKIQLLRANPHNASLKGWLSTAEQQGFDPARLQRQLTELQLQDQQPWASNDKPLDP